MGKHPLIGDMDIRQLNDDELQEWQQVLGAQQRNRDIAVPDAVREARRQRICDIDTELLRRWKKRSQRRKR